MGDGAVGVGEVECEVWVLVDGFIEDGGRVWFEANIT